VIANLELMPKRVNSSKRDKVGGLQVSLAEKFYAAGLLSRQELAKVKQAAKESFASIPVGNSLLGL